MDKAIGKLGLFLMLLFCALFAQLNYIQFWEAPTLNEKPGNSRPIDQAFNQPRGTVSTADGVIIAQSVPVDTKKKYLREFPERDLYAQITGYFNYNFGATGLESAYNSELSGKTPEQQVKSIGDLVSERDRSGNLTLTVRSDVQKAARDALGDQKGSVVAIDPRSGGVLALWSWPSFDPNLLSTHDSSAAQQAKALLEGAKDQPLLARSYRQVYPPGSTFKVVTMATALRDQKVTPETTYPRLTSLDLPQTTTNLRNFAGESCGGTLFEVLAHSCNTSFGQMGLDLGGPDLIKGARDFGFNERPPFDLPAVASQFPDVDFAPRLPALAQSAIGQYDVRATPLEMALVAAGIANNGTILAPHVVDEIRDKQGDLVKRIKPSTWKSPIDAGTADLMRQAMRQVVQNGTASTVRIDGLDVGAKTGTAQFQDATGTNSTHAWMIAWAGPEGQAPTVAVAVIVEGKDAVSDQTGGRYAGPIVKRVIEAAMAPMPAPPQPTTPTTAPGATTTTPGGN